MGMEADTQLLGFWAKVVLLIVTLTLTATAGTGGGSAPTFRRTVITELTVIVSDTIKIPCKVQGDPPPFITWYYNGESISASTHERFHIHRKSLKISNVTKADEGEYKCKAENDHGVIWGSTKLKVVNDEDDLATKTNPMDDLDEVKGKPQWSHKKDNVDFLIRPATQSVKMDCDVQGYPTPKITWFKDGKSIKPDGNKYIMQLWSLTIKDLALVDKGDYTCVIQNEFGTLSWTYTLDINQRLPVAPIIEGPRNQTVLRGENASFECQILMSDSQPLLQWLKHKKINGSYVNEEGEPYVDVLQQSGWQKPIDDPQYLVLYNVSEKDEGWYTCLVANSLGMNYVSAYLTIVNDTRQMNNSTSATAMVGESSPSDNFNHKNTLLYFGGSCVFVFALIIIIIVITSL